MNKYFKLILILVVIDIILKVLANIILPYNQEIGNPNLGFYLYLTYNKGVAGVWAQDLLNYPYSRYLANAISNIVLGTYIILIRNKPWKKWIKISTSILLIYIITIIALFIIKIFQVDISTYFTSLMNKLGPSFLVFSFFVISKNKRFKYIWSIILAAGIGNLLNHFYPPFMIIDFIQIDIATKLFGIGVMNLSDIYYDIGIVLLIGYSVIYFISKLKRAKPNKIFKPTGSRVDSISKSASAQHNHGPAA